MWTRALGAPGANLESLVEALITPFLENQWLQSQRLQSQRLQSQRLEDQPAVGPS